MHDHELDQIGATPGNPTVVYAGAQVSGDSRLACDFLTGTTGLVARRASDGLNLLLFSGSGFSPALTEDAHGREDVELIDLERLYHGS